MPLQMNFLVFQKLQNEIVKMTTSLLRTTTTTTDTTLKVSQTCAEFHFLFCFRINEGEVDIGNTLV